jgi:cytoskeletal protein CcmA (bactofilin family)
MADLSDVRAALSEPVVLVPAGTTLVGRTTSSTPQHLLIEGSYVGSIELAPNSRLVIAQGADVQAEQLKASTILLLGRFEGHIDAAAVEVGPRAKARGSIRYTSSFACQPGARLNAGIEGPEDGDV